MTAAIAGSTGRPVGTESQHMPRLPLAVSEARAILHKIERTGPTAERVERLRQIGELFFRTDGLEAMDQAAYRIAGAGPRRFDRKALLADAWDGIGEGKRKWIAA